ncbi:MAG: type III-A CRISPR-associated RAMP protein Csm3 [Deltaproteobacteria bacterium]|nr:type III-A CRISPR-associated RAMP protein Csm3 [Deltaproteobacteria bacterium]
MSSIANIEFKSKVFVSGTITALTGLHIGGSSTEMSIGGADTIVIRDPIRNYPYIPGSSLRGKMRSLFERARSEMTFEVERKREDDEKETVSITSMDQLAVELGSGAKLTSAGPSTAPGAAASKLFGVAIDKQKSERPEDIIPQRLVVRDAKLTNPEQLLDAKNTDMPLTEVKTEVAIDRITSQANPRQIERVPAGAQFQFEFILNLYGEDKPAEFVRYLFECMELLHDDYLGGHGSRGYGRVAFDVQSISQKTAQDYRENNAAQPLDIEIPASLKRGKDREESVN